MRLIEKRDFNFLAILLFFLSVVYILINFLHTRNTFLFMSWNLFLAIIPLFISILMYKILNLNSTFSIVLFFLLGILWLLFFPNAPYIITDLIHIPGNFEILVDIPHDLNPEISKRVFVFNDDINIWIKLINIFTGVLLGMLSGFVSLYLHHDYLRKKFGRLISWLFVLVIHLLTGYAVTIGRFKRWNSWNALNPKNIPKIIIDHWNVESFEFTIIFFLMSFIYYFLFYMLIKFLIKSQMDIDTNSSDN